MPNVAAEVRAGTFCYAPGSAIDNGTLRSLLDLFGLLGDLIHVEERLMDAATAISGCGPAFFALVVESLTDAGVKEGLDARQAVAARPDHDGRHRGAAAHSATRCRCAAP